MGINLNNPLTEAFTFPQQAALFQHDLTALTLPMHQYIVHFACHQHTGQPNALYHLLATDTQVDLTPLSRNELLAFGINLYNALIVHTTVVVGAPKTTLERASFFSKDAAYIIGGQTYACEAVTVFLFVALDKLLYTILLCTHHPKK